MKLLGLIIYFLVPSLFAQPEGSLKPNFRNCSWEETPYQVAVDCPVCASAETPKPGTVSTSPVKRVGPIYFCGGLIKCQEFIGNNAGQFATYAKKAPICLSNKKGVCPDAQTCLDDKLENPNVLIIEQVRIEGTAGTAKPRIIR